MKPTKVNAAQRLLSATKVLASNAFVRMAAVIGSLLQGSEAKGTLVNQHDGDPGVIFTAAAGNDVISFGIEELTQMLAQLRRAPEARIYGKIISSTRFQITVRTASGAPAADPMDLLHDITGLAVLKPKSSGPDSFKVQYDGNPHEMKYTIGDWVTKHNGTIDTAKTKLHFLVWKLPNHMYVKMDLPAHTVELIYPKE